MIAGIDARGCSGTRCSWYVLLMIHSVEMQNDAAKARIDGRVGMPRLLTFMSNVIEHWAQKWYGSAGGDDKCTRFCERMVYGEAVDDVKSKPLTHRVLKRATSQFPIRPLASLHVEKSFQSVIVGCLRPYRETSE